MRVQLFFRFFLLFIVCLAALSNLVLGQETFPDEELDAMSDEELELICLVRGFELLKDQIDEATGEVYVLTHGDYVESAKQCLSIEKEMYVLSAAINIGDQMTKVNVLFFIFLHNLGIIFWKNILNLGKSWKKKFRKCKRNKLLG
jgi:hypothetical protein